MKYDPLQARVMLVDGPVAVCLHQASEQELLDAFKRLQRLVGIAVVELAAAHKEEKRNEFAAHTQR